MSDSKRDKDAFARKEAVLLHRKGYLIPSVGALAVRHFNYSWTVPDNLPEQFLLLSNHEAYLDPMLLYVSFPNHAIHFFIGEQVCRKPVLGRLARFANDPIPVSRQVSDAMAVRSALAIMRNGGSVGLYPAGECEWDGHAMPYADSIGKFVKLAKVPLVTFNCEGLYFFAPRWGAKSRQLPTHGRVVGVYGASELAAMSAAEVTDIVRRDLSFDSTAWRAALDQPTRGRNLAEWLETVLYLCPNCGKLGTLHSHGNTLSCECGLSVRYTDRDVFNEDAPFHTVHEWRLWQRSRLEQTLEQDRGALSVSVEDARLYVVRPAKGQELVARGRFSLSEAGISCGAWGCALADVRGLALVGKDRVIFSTGEQTFEARHKRPWGVVMFADLYQLLENAGKRS